MNKPFIDDPSGVAGMEPAPTADMAELVRALAEEIDQEDFDGLDDETEGEEPAKVSDLPDEPAGAADAETGKKKKLSGAKRKARKIAAQAREIAEKDALIRDLMAEIDRLAEADDAVEPAPEPIEADFETPADHQRAVTEQSVANAVRGIRQEEKQLAAYHDLLKANQEREQLARAQFEERLEAARPRMPDYDEKVEALLARLEGASAAIPAHVLEEINLSRKGPELLYLMAGDDGFLLELMQSDPVSAARAIGRREALLSANKQKLQSTAPAPRQAPRGGSAGSADPEAMSYTDYRKFRGFGGA